MAGIAGGGRSGVVEVVVEVVEVVEAAMLKAADVRGRKKIKSSSLSITELAGEVLVT
jgi:hypothetical protein